MNIPQIIEIILVDDHKILRDGLKNIIQKKTNLQIIGEAANGREAVKLCSKLNPKVVITDISMEGLNGIEATRQILKDKPDIKIIGLSMHSNKKIIQSFFNAGGYGYLLKDGDADELLVAITTVMEKRKYLSKSINQSYLTFIEDAESTKLSSRETEVLQLIAEGKSSKEIGEQLFLSSKTVDVHKNNVMKKLNLFTIPELTKYAIREGLTNL